MRFAYLGSGSRGNAALVESRDTCVLLDCGFSLRETERRLARLGREPVDITAVLVTHEHSDHIGGVARFARRHGIPVWMTAGTAAAAGQRRPEIVQVINTHAEFRIGTLHIEPVPVPHDAREPCQFVFSDQRRKLGVLTDTGHITPRIRASYRDCDAIALECNHDLKLLTGGPYPQALKRRVSGAYGHLNNQQSAELLGAIDTERLQHAIAVHVSDKNNSLTLARDSMQAVMPHGVRVEVAGQDDGLDWREIV